MKTQTTDSCLSTVTIAVGTYALAELIHHGLLAGYLAPWLTSLGLTASTVMYITWAGAALTVALLGWMIWKFFINKA